MQETEEPSLVDTTSLLLISALFFLLSRGSFLLPFLLSLCSRTCSSSSLSFSRQPAHSRLPCSLSLSLFSLSLSRVRALVLTCTCCAGVSPIDSIQLVIFTRIVGFAFLGVFSFVEPDCRSFRCFRHCHHRRRR